MIPVLDRIHVIPIDEGGDDLHVASAECWCNPKVEPQPDADTDICTHNAITGPDHEGWVLIGERF